MIKKSYTITGFDCPNCARKTEEHLNKNEYISSARIDFATNRLYLSFKDKELTIDEIKEIIKEVESDNITIEAGVAFKKKEKIFTVNLLVVLFRIIFGVIIIIISLTAFHEDTSRNFWINFSLFLVAILVLTYDIFFKVFLHIKSFENPIDEYLLILIAVFGSFAVATISKSSHDFIESVMVVGLFQLGRIIEGIAANKSKQAIMAAVDLRVEEASLVSSDGIIKIKPEKINIGDIILVKMGETIPIDGTVVDGQAFIDTSSLTGEYIPKDAQKGENVYSGCTIKSGSIKIVATKKYDDSTVAKIIELIANSSKKKSKADKFITTFARWYTPLVFLGSILFAVIGGLVSKDWSTYILNGLKMLVVACPCAVVISVPMAYFSSIGLASKNGIVIKGTNYLDELYKMKKLVTDKTGTLTHGSFVVSEIIPSNVSEKQLLDYLYASECLSTHPIGKAICHGKDFKKLASEQKDFKEILGLGVETNYKGKHIYSGNIKLMKKLKVEIPNIDKVGNIVYCCVDDIYVGCALLNDEIKEDAEPMVSLLHQENIEIILLTGDKEENAKDVCKKLNIDRFHSDLMPHQKIEYLTSEMSKKHEYSTVYVGDGINDAACIKLSDVGVAMGGIGSDVAVENADVVIMNDDPAKIYDAYKISKIAKHTAIFNVAVALSIKLLIEILTIVGTITKAFSVPMVVAVIADTGLTVALVINSLLILYRKIKRKIKK